MTPENISEVIDVYKKFFADMGTEPIKYPHEKILNDTFLSLSHCYGMLDDIEGFIKNDQIEKAFRWLGFIQGILWSTQKFSLTELKNHNRPD